MEGKINICKSMVTYLLSNIDDCHKANMGSAAVMLRLMPTILVHLDPIIGEMALVSAHQLVLAIFFAKVRRLFLQPDHSTSTAQGRPKEESWIFRLTQSNSV